MSRKRGVIILAGIMFGTLLYGQTSTNLPYSRYGIGSLIPSTIATNSAMGGISAGVRDPLFMNFGNPASYSAVDTLSFVFDFGMTYDRVNLKNNTDNFLTQDVNFHHLTFGFPITKGLGFAAGVIPFSTGNYSLVNNVNEGSPSYREGIGAYEYLAYGNGGVHKAFLGTALNITPNFSIGVSGTYYFGLLEKNWDIVFSDLASSFNSKVQQEYRLRGAGLDAGAQYTAHFNDEYYMTIGVSYRLPSKWKIDETKLQQQFTLFSNSQASDTITFSEQTGRNFDLPQSLTAGIVVGKKDFLKVGIDYHMDQWGDADYAGITDSLVNTTSLRAGLELTPTVSYGGSYFSKIHYRLGGHLDKTYLQIADEQIDNFGISFGLGLPVGKGRSRLNFSVEYGQRGALSNMLYKEEYWLFGLSINLHEYWFVQRKFD